MEKVLYVMRATPGGGKSFKAKSLAPKENIFATDDYWINDKGDYIFDYKKLGISHKWNQDRVKVAMSEGKTPIVVDNTNVTKKEYAPYVALAEMWGYSVKFEFPESPWWMDIAPRIKDKTFTEDDVKVFLEKNTHNVPEAVIRNMMKKFEF